MLAIVKEAKKVGQPLIIAGGPQQYQQITLIFDGTSANVLHFLAYLKRQYPKILKIFVGETIEEWENLYESYEKVLQIEELNDFYPDLLPTFAADLAEEIRESEFSFLPFLKMLSRGNYNRKIPAILPFYSLRIFRGNTRQQPKTFMKQQLKKFGKVILFIS